MPIESCKGNLVLHASFNVVYSMSNMFLFILSNMKINTL